MSRPVLSNKANTGGRLFFYYKNIMKHFFMDSFAFFAILSTVLVITTNNPVVAIIFLISVFFNAVGYLILNGIGFIALSYILLYIGAITVLFLFVLMMINIRLTDILQGGSEYTKNIPLAIVIGSFFIFEIFTIIPFSVKDLSNIPAVQQFVIALNEKLIFETILSYIRDFSLSTVQAVASVADNNQMFEYALYEVNSVFKTIQPQLVDITITTFIQIKSIGQSLYTKDALLLITCSVILLLALIAPIFISLSRSERKKNNQK